MGAWFRIYLFGRCFPSGLITDGGWVPVSLAGDLGTLTSGRPDFTGASGPGRGRQP